MPPRRNLVVFGGHRLHRFASDLTTGRRDGRPVRVVSRAAGAGSPPFDSPLVEIMRGDVAKREDVERAMAGAKQVVNLAHGGGGTTLGRDQAHDGR